MGMSKALLPFGPELMLARVVRLLSEVVEPIVVVGSSGQDLPDLPESVMVARDRRDDRGPLEGLCVGLAAIQGHVDAAYVTACDVPLLASDFVRRMIQWLGDHQIVVPKEGQFYHPLAAVYRTSVLPNIQALFSADRMRPVFLFDQVDTLAVPIDDLRDADPQLATLENLNRPEDYHAALARAGFKPPVNPV